MLLVMSLTLLVFATITTTVVYSTNASIIIEGSNYNDYGSSNETSLQAFRGDVNDNNATGVSIGRTFLLLHLLKEKLKKLHDLDNILATPPPFNGCICVTFYLCGPNGMIISNGSIIDIHVRQCTGNYEVCCSIRIVIPPQPTPGLPTTVPTTPTSVQMTVSNPPTVPTSTIPTTLSTTTMTTTTTTTTAKPIQYAYCYCVAIYQCTAGGGQVMRSGVIPAVTCTGALICCSYYPGVLPVPIPNLVPNVPSLIIPIAPPQLSPIIVQPPVIAPPVVAPPVIAPPLPPAVLPVPILPAIVYGQSCVCVLVAVCNLGYLPMSGLGSIDPRLVLARQGQPPGSCESGSMCCKIQQGTAGAAQQIVAVQASLDPRPSNNLLAPGYIKNSGTPNACSCILMDRCPEGQAVTFDNVGAIDPRFGPCMSSTLVCCKFQDQPRDDTVVGTMNVPNSSSNEPRTSNICGLQNTTYAISTLLTAGTSYFAEFPWMAMLLIRRAGSADVFQCGGSLISNRAVLTAAHCVISCDPESLIVRLGEWDTRITTEPLPFQEIGVQNISIHPQYYAGALYNDVAIVVLSRAASYAMNVRPICLPSQGQVFSEGTICYASGWGRSAFGPNGGYQAILSKVDLPIVSNANCQTRLRQTRLGPSFYLHSSFICAGGEENKDTCSKDGGGPLVCQDSSLGRFVQAGIVSWGIGCGNRTPGVYASVSQAQQWIVQQTHGATN